MAKKGQNDQSYVAVDDFEFLQVSVCDFLPSEAKPTTSTTAKTTTTSQNEINECDFEDENLCGWQIFPAPPDFPFTWERTNGLILQENGVVGPAHDHAEQNDSEYFAG